MDQPMVEDEGPVAVADARTAAFEQLAAAHLDEAYRLARVVLGRPADAEDAVHDAFETAWRKWPDLRDPTRFQAWFSRIVVNTCRDHLRRSARRRTEDVDERASMVDPYAHSDARDALDRALARLKPDDQLLLALRYYRDLGIDDIAMLLDLRPGTVMSRVHRARARLRTILAAHEGSER